MRILYLEQDSAFLKKQVHLFHQWGYDVLIANQVTDVYHFLEQSEESFHVLCIGTVNVHNEALKLIQKVRSIENYIYILCLYHPRDRFKGEVLLETGADEMIVRNESQKYFKLRLVVVQRLLSTLHRSTDTTLGSRITELQILDLKRALDQVEENRQLLKSLITALMKNVESFLGTSAIPAKGELKEAAFNAEMLGAYWLQSDLNILLDSVINAEDAGQAYISETCINNVHTSIRKLNEGVLSLEQFGFFREEGKEDRDTDSLKGYRILVAEDVPVNQALVKMILMKLEAEVITASNGYEAIEIWQADSEIDMILMDMNMPLLDGFQATSRIREIEKEKGLERIPIIALTALAMRGDKERCLKEGCDDFLAKPIVKHNLTQIVFQWLKQEFYKTEKNSLEINRAIMRVDNQISSFCLQEALLRLGIEVEVFSDAHNLLEAVKGQETDLVILDARVDVNLAYYIKTRNLDQIILMIGLEDTGDGSSFVMDELSINFPIVFEEVVDTLKKVSQRIFQTRKRNHALEYAKALGTFDSRTALKDTVDEFQGQLAVWQKSYGEIGGDLVLGRRFNLHDRMGLILADVTGHDAKSAYVASWFSGLVQGVWDSHTLPKDLLVHLNDLYPHNENEEDKRYVCSLVLLWDRVRQNLMYANAGIPAGLIIRANGKDSEWVEWTGSPVGMFEGLDMFSYDSLDLKYGDRLIIASDGILEALPEETFKRITEHGQEMSVQGMLDTVVDFVSRTIDMKDDLTLVVLEASPLPLDEMGLRFVMQSSFSEIDRVMSLIEEALIERETRIKVPEAVIAIREGLLNAVEHGNQKNKDESVDIDLIIQESFVKVVVSDRGAGFNYERVKKKLEIEGPFRIQGRGIQLMEGFSDQVIYNRGSLTLEFNENELGQPV